MIRCHPVPLIQSNGDSNEKLSPQTRGQVCQSRGVAKQPANPQHLETIWPSFEVDF